MMTPKELNPSSFGPYRILQHLGTGAYSEIYQVEKDRQTFALKKNKPQYTYDRDVYSILDQEGEILRQLQNMEHFPQLLDSGVLEECHYLVMEYVEGLTLTELLQYEGKPLPPLLSCHIALEICKGLEELHQLKTPNGNPMIHGDLKLDNVMINLQGQLKIIDVGLKGGTFRYVPLERHEEKKITPFSDIYALGHILYELLHGRHLIEKGTKSETYFQMKGLKISEDLFEADIPLEIKEILIRCLQQGGGKEYTNISELKNDLESILQNANYPLTPQSLADWIGKYKKPRIEIKKIGHFLPKTEEGYLINESNADRIVAPWTEAVERVKNAYLEHLGDRVHSIYLRGSVGKGQGIPGISDIDTFAVLQGSQDRPDLSWARELYRDFKEKFPFANGVDIGFIFYEDLFKGMSLLSYRFIIKVLAACIYGENLAEKIKGFKPSLKIAFFYHGNLREVLNEAIENIEKAPGPAQVKIWSNYALRRIIRLGFAMKIDHEKEYTRDLYPCYEVFSKYYPEKEQEMRKALELVLNLPTQKEQILPFLYSFGGWLIGESERIFGGRK